MFIKLINLGMFIDLYNFINDVKLERIVLIFVEVCFEFFDEVFVYMVVGFRCLVVVFCKDFIVKFNELIRIVEDFGERGRVIMFEG